MRKISLGNEERRNAQMSLTWWLDQLKGWQAGIGALLGFTLGTWVNHGFNRRRDKVLRREEMILVSIAVYGEIISIREDVGKLAMAIADIEANGDRIFDDQFLKDHPLPTPIIYPSLATRIGLVSSELLIPITGFYSNLTRINAALPLLIERIIERERLLPGGERKRREERRIYHPATVLRPAIATIDDVKPALRRIEKLGRMPPAEDPPISLARMVLEDAERRFEEQDEAGGVDLQPD
jgi:hypothetical protein